MKKTCSKCLKTKAISFFGLCRNGDTRDGFNGHCKQCKTEAARVWRAKYPNGVGPLAKYTRRYAVQKGDAKRRGIKFLLTFKQWLKIWTASGHLDESGSRRGQYHMARTGDKGPYAVGNVRICTAEENSSEKRHSEAHKRSMRGNTYALGTKHTAKVRAQIIATQRRNRLAKLASENHP